MKFVRLHKPWRDKRDKRDRGDLLVNLEAVEYFDVNEAGGNAVVYLRGGGVVYLRETLEEVRRKVGGGGRGR